MCVDGPPASVDAGKDARFLRAFPYAHMIAMQTEDASETDRGGAEDHSRGERRPGGANSVADLGQGCGRAGRRGERRREQR